MSDNFSFGAPSRMREVPLGQYAELSFSGIMSVVETEWGEKHSFQVTLFSHPSYESIPKHGIETVWETKSVCGKELFTAASEGNMPALTEALKKNWKLIRSEEGTYFVEQINDKKK